MTITWHGDGGFTRTSMNRAGLYPRGPARGPGAVNAASADE
jgi:hypothetical protein